MMKWLALILGGAGGTASRYLLSSLIHETFGTAFPLGTLAVNLIGCFLIGLFDAFAEEKLLISLPARLFLVTGFCGAFTTFSTFILETHYLLRHGEIFKVLLYLTGSVVAGYLIFRLGFALGKGF